MLVNADYNQDLISCLVERIHQEFQHFEVDTILDVGSRAKGESTPLSDFDFQVTGRDAGRIISNKLDINSDIVEVLPYLIDSQVASIYGLPLLEIEHERVNRISDYLEQKFEQKVSLVFVDTRTCVLNLSFETPFSAFRTHWFTLTSNIVFDRCSMQPALQNQIIHDRCFHWEQTIDLQVARFVNHRKLNAILGVGTHPHLMEAKNFPEDILLSWIKWGINYLRFAIGTWSLALNGYYVYRRDDVLRFMAANLPQRCLEIGLQLYRQKQELQLGINCVPHGKPWAQLPEALGGLQAELDYLLNCVSSKITMIRPRSEKRKYIENSRSLLNLAAEWFTVPQLDIQEWISASLEGGKSMLRSYGR
jgi:hypothetical protein